MLIFAKPDDSKIFLIENGEMYDPASLKLESSIKARKIIVTEFLVHSFVKLCYGLTFDIMFQLVNFLIPNHIKLSASLAFNRAFVH